MNKYYILVFISAFASSSYAADDGAAVVTEAQRAEFIANPLFETIGLEQHNLLTSALGVGGFAEQYRDAVIAAIDAAHCYPPSGDDEDHYDEDDIDEDARGGNMENGIVKLGMIAEKKPELAPSILEQFERIRCFDLDYCYNGLVEALSGIVSLPAPTGPAAFVQLIAIAEIIGAQSMMATETLKEVVVVQAAESEEVLYPAELIRIAAIMLDHPQESVVEEVVEALDNIAEKKPEHAPACRDALIAHGKLGLSRQNVA